MGLQLLAVPRSLSSLGEAHGMGTPAMVTEATARIVCLDVQVQHGRGFGGKCPRVCKLPTAFHAQTPSQCETGRRETRAGEAK